MPRAPLKLLFWQGLVASMRLNPAASPLLTSPSSSILNSWSFLPPKTGFFTCGLFVRSCFDHVFFSFFKSEWRRFWEWKWRCQLLLRDRLRFLPGHDRCPAVLPHSPLLPSSLQPVGIGHPGCPWALQRLPLFFSSSLHSRRAVFQLLHTGMLDCLMKCWTISIQISVWTALTLMPFPPTTPASFREPHTYLWSVSKVLTPDLLFPHPHPQHLTL